jgi:hypothetical protein
MPRCGDKIVRKALHTTSPPLLTIAPPSPPGGILKPYHPQIDALIAKYPDLSAVRVLEEISRGPEGFGGIRSFSEAQILTPPFGRSPRKATPRLPCPNSRCREAVENEVFGTGTAASVVCLGIIQIAVLRSSQACVTG